jgi:glycosyltransferase involved in cell wall biosynthesis
MKINPLVSVIVPTRNSEQTIEMCLFSVSKQSYSDIEVIVVDNFSSDKTRDIATMFNARVLVKGPERSSQRNYGALLANGEYLLFVDSDMKLTPKVVENCVNIVLKNNAKTVIIPELSIGNDFWAKVKALDRSTLVGDSLFEVARFFDRKFFEQLNGYDEEITGFEDSDIQARIEEANVSSLHSKEWILHYESSAPFGKQLMKMYYYLNNSQHYIKKHPTRARRQLNPIRRSYIKNFKLMVKNPFYTLGLLFFKFCEGAIGIIGIISKNKPPISRVKTNDSIKEKTANPGCEFLP